jgi:ABC-type Zn uptake system ZnuABC Zn-binding protein ZnuA
MVDANATTIFVDPVYSSNYAMTLKVELEHRLRRNFQVSHLYLMLGPVDDLDYFGQMEANLQNLKSALR